MQNHIKLYSPIMDRRRRGLLPYSTSLSETPIFAARYSSRVLSSPLLSVFWRLFPPSITDGDTDDDASFLLSLRCSLRRFPLLLRSSSLGVDIVRVSNCKLTAHRPTLA